jgi:hypothetical protein
MRVHIFLEKETASALCDRTHGLYRVNPQLSPSKWLFVTLADHTPVSDTSSAP